MVNEIKVLDEKVISQIAAGEVIERPASVVKELVENAIDAGSSQIIIKIVDGGKKSIKVVDDGAGMSKENAKKAFYRHSTSKITTLRDLESISSLGFRGEALASIAAVSKVTLITKSKDDNEMAGCEILIEGGKEKHVKEVASNIGTTLKVSELFYNMPARRKYLKTQRAELAKITDLVTRFALNHHEISFRLIHNGSEIIDAPFVKTPLDNITYIYGKEIAKELLEINHSDPEIKIQGFISKPAVFRKSSSHISFFVNDRYITSQLLLSALKEGYGNLIMKNREKQVFDSLKNAVEQALSERSLIPDMGEVTLESPQLKAFDVHEIDRLPIFEDIIPFVESKKQIDILEFTPSSQEKGIIMLQKKKKFDKIPKMALIGQILNTYIVTQSEDSILIIDQHAAHERVVFEKLMKYQENENSIQQQLLAPLTLELTPEQKKFVTDKKELLDSLGFKIDSFGGDTFQVRTLPAELRDTDNKNMVYDIIDELIILGKSKKKTEFKEKAMAVVACHSAIRGGEELSNTQMKNLIQSLYSTKNVTSCPHGRPSILSMSRSDLEKKFKRK
jgi:DNA mismatch repair protein MutL